MLRLSRLEFVTPLFLAVIALPVGVSAQQGDAFYAAELATSAAEARIIAGGVVWNCTGTTCTAPRSGARPLRLCSDLARRAGPVSKFTAKGEALAADKMAICNR